MPNPDFLTLGLCAFPFALFLIVWGGNNARSKRINHNKKYLVRTTFGMGVIMFFGLIFGAIEFMDNVPDEFWTNQPANFGVRAGDAN